MIIDDLIAKHNPGKVYRSLSFEQRQKVERKIFEVGHDRWLCQDYGINYVRPVDGHLTLLAMHELGYFPS